MATKKDEDAKQAEQEAEIARLQNTFLTIPLVPKEYLASVDEPISPAVYIDETAEPLVQVKEKESLSTTKSMPLHPLNAQASPMQHKPRIEKKPDLGAAESLLFGLMPSGDVKSNNADKKIEPQAEPQRESDTSSSATGLDKQVDYKSPDDLSSQARDLTPTPVVVVQGEDKSQGDRDKLSDQNNPQQDGASSQESSKLLEGDERMAESGGAQKGGMLSRAKSLFSNITKKDKKE